LTEEGSLFILLRVDSIVTRLLAPFVWPSPTRAAATLLGFARAERSSMLELVLAASRTSSPARAALYLEHAADERRHARMFIGRAVLLGAQDAASVGHADEHALFEQLGEAGFLAFVCHGERRGLRQLGAHRAYFVRHGDARMTALFDAILEDEVRHAKYTWDELVACEGGDRAARRALRRAALRDAKLAYKRMARAIASRVYRVLMLFVYVLCAPFALLARLSRRDQ
jgi:hypothetical protein